MATATMNTYSAHQNTRTDKSANLGSAVRSFFSGFRSSGVSGHVLNTAAQLGPEQLKEVGGLHDAQTGLVYGSR